MVDEKKEPEPPPAPPPTRRRFGPIAWVAAGAVLAGAGLVFALPKGGGGSATPPPPRIEIVHYPDKIVHMFNPRVERGTKSVRLGFTLDVQMDANQRAEIEGLIRTNWDRANSRVLMLLKDQPLQTFTSGAEGMRTLAHEIATDLSATLFPAGQAKIVDVIYTDMMVQ
jgi:flagellar basal body-associated protein FliL